MAAAKLFHVFSQPLAYRLRAAYDRVTAGEDIIPHFDRSHELLLCICPDLQHRSHRSISRRNDRQTFEQLLDEVPEMRLELFARLLVGLCDIDRHKPSELARARCIATFLGCIAEVVEVLAKD